jgi:chromosome partitioning protein
MIYAIVNMKGGVGKTTTTVNLGAALAAEGKRVLIVDLDAQENTTQWMGTDPRPEGSAANVLRKPKTVENAIGPCAAIGVDLLYGSSTLATVRDELRLTSQRPSAALRAALKELALYDYVLIDCPPGLDLLQINAIAACDTLIVPVDSQTMSLAGVSKIHEAIEELVEAEVIPRAPSVKILVTKYDGRIGLSRGIIDHLTKHNFPMFQNKIRTNTKLAECYGWHKTIFEYAPTSTGAEDYAALAQEVLGKPVEVLA